jgi:hypothetical protein
MQRISFAPALLPVVFILSFSVVSSRFATAESPAQEASEPEDGFVSIFDGESLDGWQGATDGYVAKDGVLICLEKGGNLYSEMEYADFHLKFEFKLTPGANNGLGIRAPLKGDVAYTGMELQILDNTADQYKNLKPWQYHGSVYGVVPAKRGHLKPVGEWNQQEVICKGSRVVVKLNGAVIVDADLQQASEPETVDGREHPGLKREKGHLAFCGHGAHVEFRNLRIKELNGEGDE